MTSLLPALLLALAPQAPADTVQPPTVVVVRHAEKADASRDPSLSEAGRARALALDSALADARVTAVIVTPYRRNAETAAPVAARHGLTPIVVPVSGGVDTHAAAVTAEAMRHGGTVLVVGHSNTVGAIVGAAVGALHGKGGLPARWIEGLTGRTGDSDDGRVFELLDEARALWWPTARD